MHEARDFDDDTTKFLSDLKELLTNWNDIPFKHTVKRVELIFNSFYLPIYYNIFFFR